MRMIKKILFLLFLLIVILIFILGYFGFVPVLSTVFGSDKPRDLGVKFTTENYNNYLTKSKEKIEKLNGQVIAENSIVYEGKQDLRQSFNQEEVSARLNYSKWKYMPVTNTQVRINKDGSVEFSGLVLADRLNGFIDRVGAGGYSKEDIDKGLGYIKLLGKNFPVYAKFNASVKDNTLNESTAKIEVGRFSIPLETVKADSVISSVTQTIFAKVAGFYAKSVSFENEKMSFEGSIPAKVSLEFAN